MEGKLGTQRQRSGKITVPDVSGLLLREHLHTRLDGAAAGRLVWLAAPAGTGKTSVLAGWIQSRNWPALWYQIDAGDRDPANFFHYLSLAARQITRRRLPVTTPENLMAPETFARRYFASLWESQKTSCILVLDNYQELPEDAVLHRIIDIAIDLLPHGSLIAIASRSAPPAALARHFSSATMTSLGWPELRLSESESGELARRWNLSAEDAARLYALSDGWAALQILLMRLPASRFLAESVKDNALLFDYIGTEIFEELTPDLSRFLMKVAIPPFVTAAQAEQLGGRNDAESILSRLARNNFLTTRHGEAGEARYQFHPLLRTFLLGRLALHLPPQEMLALRRLAVRQLEEDGEVEAAAELLRDSADWATLATLVCRHAGEWLATGRVATLRHWLESLPAETRKSAPWLLYWHGSLLRMTDPRAGRAQLEPAWQMFRERGDAAGAYLTWAAIVESYAAPWDEYLHIPAWLEKLEALRQECPEIPSPEIEAQLVGTAKTIAISAPFSPLVEQWLARAEAFAVDAPSPRHIGAFTLLTSFKSVWRSESVARIKAVLGAIRLPPDFSEKYPLSYILYCIGLGLLEAYDLNPEGCQRWVAKGLETSRNSGIQLLDTMLAIVSIHGSVVSGNVAAAENTMTEAERLVNPTWKADMFHLRYLQAGIKLMAGDTAAALRFSAGIAEGGEAVGARYLAVFPKLLRSLALAIDGQWQEARTYLPEILETGRRFPSPWMVFQGELVAAHIHFAQDESADGLAALRRAMAAGRAADIMVMRFWLPEFIAPLCARALNAGIEVDYVRRLIRTRGLLPISPCVDAWPWPVRIYTLGRFSVLRENTPIAFSGKAQKRPLQLLKALVACGGRDVSGMTLAAALWKDEINDARHALDMTVSRLRKLLGSEAAVIVQDGKVSLNDKLCFVDIWSFERHANEAEKRPGADGLPLHAGAMALYLGQFLNGEDDEAWLLPRRERLRSRYLRLALEYGALLEKHGEGRTAVDTYQRAIEIEPLAEELVQRLMRIHIEAGRTAQALEVFRRCRHMLSVVLGLPPSAATLDLAEKARTC